ncbi:MAG TPA: hypothetical protein VKJ65_07155 [Phycisphaerae bacterium]|nr:hypothetical protein [Phycisphaerae bacterium]
MTLYKFLAALAGAVIAYVLFNEYQNPGSGLAVLTGPSQPVMALAKAISVAEGFGEAGAIPTLANNPGDITDVGQNLPGDTGQRLGAGIIVFATATDGWNALYAQATRMLSGTDSLYPASDTLQAVGGVYANDPVGWPANVAAQLGVSINTTLGQLAGNA